MKTEPRVAVVLLFLFAFCFIPERLLGQPVVAGVEIMGVTSPSSQTGTPQPAWGTASPTVKVIKAQSFTGVTSFTQYVVSAANLTRYPAVAGGAGFEAGVELPAGAHIVEFELEACDTNSGASVSAFLFRTASPAAGNILLASVDSTDPATPGCARFDTNIENLNQFVDNQNNMYTARVILTGPDASTSFAGVRIYYKLRVSPAPPAQTFLDVPPSHLFYQYIEALAASGITAGCGGGNYCPDASMTRGQMAVFLARALGLHFPN